MGPKSKQQKAALARFNAGKQGRKANGEFSIITVEKVESEEDDPVSEDEWHDLSDSDDDQGDGHYNDESLSEDIVNSINISEVNNRLTESNMIVWNVEANKIRYIAFGNSDRSKRRRMLSNKQVKEAGKRNGNCITSYFSNINETTTDPGSDVEAILDQIGDDDTDA
jgi:hypothetical protein